jgi:predicted flap endonuclease-1-like 5' DNA nuclease
MPPEGDGDDLKVIEGIGPRIEEVLQAAGVTTYAGLADLRPGRVQTIMREAGKRMAKPDTWPEQARLAAAGEWQALKDLQDSLKRGVPAS